MTSESDGTAMGRDPVSTRRPESACHWTAAGGEAGQADRHRPVAAAAAAAVAAGMLGGTRIGLAAAADGRHIRATVRGLAMLAEGCRCRGRTERGLSVPGSMARTAAGAVAIGDELVEREAAAAAAWWVARR